MKKFVIYIFGCLLFLLFNCKQQNEPVTAPQSSTSTIRYANGFSIVAYDGLYVVQVAKAGATAKESSTYVLKRAAAVVPDSLQHYTQIQIPIQTIMCTSTTHLPGLTILGEASSLLGFSGLEYVSDEAVRQLIEAGKVRELGPNEALDVEQIIDAQPALLMAFAMDATNKSLETIQKAGIPVLYNGDWTEQHPLGKAEWIKLFGVLFDKEQQANQFFDQVVTDYQTAKASVDTIQEQPTVFSGVMFGDVWYLPEGKSWAAFYFNEARTNYLWKETPGVGSLALSFEQVLERAKEATYWLNPGPYESLADLIQANPHYAEFDAFKNKRVYSFAPTKGVTGGTLFYEVGGYRPDLVLQDLIHLIHPTALPEYQPFFYKKLH